MSACEQVQPPRLIALSGYARTGKDTIAGMLGEAGYLRVAFADPIYAAVLEIDPLVRVEPSAGPRYWLRRDRRLSEVVSRHGWDWVKVHCPEGRRLLNATGAAVRRVDPQFWVSATMSSLLPGRRYVITDARFPREAQAVTQAGGVLVRVVREGTGPALDPAGIPYASDVALDDWSVDALLCNHSESLDRLAEDVLALMGRLGRDASNPVHT